MNLVRMGNRDARRLGLIQAAVQGKITNGEGAAAVGLSVRQFERLRSRVRRLGAQGVVHGNRGRPSARRLAERTRQNLHQGARATGMPLVHVSRPIKAEPQNHREEHLPSEQLSHPGILALPRFRRQLAYAA